jgi:hypothetical protein
MTTQEAYAEVAALLHDANEEKKKVDALVAKAAKLARKYDLVFEQRFKDALPEVLNPDLYEEVEEEEPHYGFDEKKNYRQLGIRKVKVKRFKDALPKEFMREHYIEPGDYVDAWIPSSLC